MDYYHDLATMALSQCPPGYNSVKVEAEVDEDYAQIGLVCSNGTAEIRVNDYSMQAGMAMHDALDGIREEMHRMSGTKWSKCIFRVAPDGSFKLDVSY